MPRRLRPLLLLGLLVVSGTCLAEDLLVIVNARNHQQIGRDDLKHIYLDKITVWSNQNRIELYHLPPGDPYRERFSRAVLGMSSDEAAMLESNLRITNTLRNIPHVREARIAAYIVSKHPNALAYVPASAIRGRPGIRIVLRIGEDGEIRP